MRRILPFLLLIPSIAGASRPELVCALAGEGLVEIDGLLDDWEAMRSLTKAGPDTRSSALAVRCAYDATTLYLSVDVTDDRLVRGRGAASDRLVLAFGEQRLGIAPAGDAAKLEVAWEKTRATPRLPRVADSLQRRGWSVELALPLAAVPGWAKGAPSLALAVTHLDADQAAGGAATTGAATGEILLTFEVAARTLKAFLDEQRLRAGDVTFDALADLDDAPGPERVIVAGKLLAVVGEGYAYVGLPVESPRDVLGVELADLTGNGKSAAVVRYRERGGGGSRDVLAVFVLRGDGFARLFAHEIAKQLGSARMENRWELRKPAKGAKGRELVITPGSVSGFTREAWNETPAEDMVPILLPWGDKREEVWRFDRDGVSGG